MKEFTFFGTLIVKHLLKHRDRVVFPRIGPCLFTVLRISLVKKRSSKMLLAYLFGDKIKLMSVIDLLAGIAKRSRFSKNDKRPLSSSVVPAPKQMRQLRDEGKGCSFLVYLE